MPVKDHEIKLRITLVNPPDDVVFAVQSGRSDLHQKTRSVGSSLSFDFSVRARTTTTGVTLLGPFAQGRPGTRFVYINSGTYAGDSASCWGRRAKVPLSGITPDLICQLEEVPAAVLEASVAGTARDGGPVCASVPLLRGWQIVE
jgi:hypothetical protein